jgi:geranylgeranyl diphosphate synthase type II
MSGSAFQVHVDELRTTVEAALRLELNRREWPGSLKEAIEYSLMAGGKRMRPLLVLLANEVCGGQRADAIAPACAIEMIHTYSLIHDDLPSMDDDDFRRGRPTSHKVFGEALAILAGDGLLTLAFELMASVQSDPGRVSESTRILALAAGGGGMVGGQVLDLEAERGPFGKAESGKPKAENQKAGCEPASRAVQNVNAPADSAASSSVTSSLTMESGKNDPNRTAETRVEELSRIHKMKTGALIVAALELGAVSAGATEDSRTRLRRYGQCIGLAFQIADDLLDVMGEQTRLGKTPGRDADLGKLTYPALLGIEPSRARARQLVQDACDAVNVFGEGGVWLKELAKFIVERDH